MPRRRMIAPSFRDDRDIAKLTRDERLFLIGCVSAADDQGRLIGHPAYLRSEIFKYDTDIDIDRMNEIKSSTLGKMQHWRPDNEWLLVSYTNADEEYLYFPNWDIQQKPSHPSPSKLPVPPSASSRIFPEPLPKISGIPHESLPNHSALGQSSLGKVSIVKSREVPEDFTSFLDSEKDLTDYLTTTLKAYLPRGPAHAMQLVKKLWVQATGMEMNSTVFETIFLALQKYPVPVLAISLIKAVKYSKGKLKPGKYILTVLEAQQKEYQKSHPP